MPDLLAGGGAGAIAGAVTYAVGRIFFNNRYPSKEVCELKHTNIKEDLDEIKATLEKIREEIKKQVR